MVRGDGRALGASGPGRLVVIRFQRLHPAVPRHTGRGTQGLVVARTDRIEADDAPVTRSATGGVVGRRALFERLAGAGRVTLVSAPAGSGKTLLLRSWIAEMGLADHAAWVEVPREHRDSQRFWIAVLDALRATVLGSTLVGPLTAAPEMDGWAIVERLLTELDALEDSLWLVLDDLHELR